MKSILIIIFAVTLFEGFVQGRFHVNNDGIVGVSQQKLKDHLINALKGFRKVMLKGDKELDYPIMDPYKVEDFSWDYIDTSYSKKYKLNFFNKNTTHVIGLANHEVKNVEVSAKDMRLSFTLSFNNLQTEFPYTIDGYMLKNYLPVFGNGLIKLSAPSQVLQVVIDLGIEQGFIIVETVKTYRHDQNADIKVTNLMDLPDEFASIVIDDILDNLVKQYGENALNKYVHDLVEEAVGGMTVEEFFDYIDHFVKKSKAS